MQSTFPDVKINGLSAKSGQRLEILFMKIYVFRHGETDWNAEHRIQGREDVPLNENGIKQAHEAGKGAQEKIRPAFFVTSNLSRAVVTGKIIASYVGTEKMFTEWGLIECSYGAMSGKVIKDIYEAENACEETPEEAGRRFFDVLDKYVHTTNDDFAVVSHGGTINAALYVLTDGKIGTGITKLKNASVTVLSWENGRYLLEKCNIEASAL